MTKSTKRNVTERTQATAQERQLLFLGVVCVCLLGVSPISSAAEKPNIVLILADDVSADMFSCYDQPGTAKTPHIDQIADVIRKNVEAETAEEV